MKSADIWSYFLWFCFLMIASLGIQWVTHPFWDFVFGRVTDHAQHLLISLPFTAIFNGFLVYWIFKPEKKS